MLLTARKEIADAGLEWLRLQREPDGYISEWSKQDTRDGFDTTFDTDTTGGVEVPDLDVYDESRWDAAPYGPTRSQVIEAAIRGLDIDRSKYTFIDFGCGKGRAVLIASTLGFARCIGVEFSPNLAGIAVENARRFAEHSSCECSIVCTNVLDYEVPETNVVTYFYEPFRPSLADRVVDKLCARANQGHEVAVLWVAQGCRAYGPSKPPWFLARHDGWLARTHVRRPLPFWRVFTYQSKRSPSAGRA
jgi:SAM-dependent methyltransferase